MFCSVVIEFLSLCVMLVLSCLGEVLGRLVVMLMVGRLMFGKFWIFMLLKLWKLNSVSMMKNRMVGIGLWID